MRIDSGRLPLGKPNLRSEPLVNSGTRQPVFSDLMQQQEDKAAGEQLQRMLEQIKQQGDRLSTTMGVRELRQYKLLIKRFLEETARRGVRIRDTRGWDRKGQARQYKLLEELDQQLLLLADELTESESGKLELLQRVGEIRGLLINVAF